MSCSNWLYLIFPGTWGPPGDGRSCGRFERWHRAYEEPGDKPGWSGSSHWFPHLGWNVETAGTIESVHAGMDLKEGGGGGGGVVSA